MLLLSLWKTSCTDLYAEKYCKISKLDFFRKWLRVACPPNPWHKSCIYTWYFSLGSLPSVNVLNVWTWSSFTHSHLPCGHCSHSQVNWKFSLEYSWQETGTISQGFPLLPEWLFFSAYKHWHKGLSTLRKYVFRKTIFKK